MPSGVFLQPRGGFPDASRVAVPTAGRGAATTATQAPATDAQSADTTATELTQPLCQTANRGLWITTGGYQLVSVVVAVLVFLLMKKRLWGSRAVRFVVVLVVACAAATALVALDPLRADDVTRCINSNEFVRFITLGGSASSRALAMGLAPAALLSLIAAAIADRNY